MEPKIWKESFFIFSLFLFLALPALWKLSSGGLWFGQDQVVQAQVVFPKEGRALASVESPPAENPHCVLKKKAQSYCDKVGDKTSCAPPVTISYWHCQSSK